MRRPEERRGLSRENKARGVNGTIGHKKGREGGRGGGWCASCIVSCFGPAAVWCSEAVFGTRR